MMVTKIQQTAVSVRLLTNIFYPQTISNKAEKENIFGGFPGFPTREDSSRSWPHILLNFQKIEKKMVRKGDKGSSQLIVNVYMLLHACK